MSKNLIFVLFILLFSMANGQVNETDQMKNMELKEIEITPPSFTGIIQKTVDPEIDILNYVANQVIYPKKALSCKISGTEVIQFNVDTRGHLNQFQVINSVCREIDDEVIRVLEQTDGMWKPGLKDGIPVDMEKEVSIVFFAESTEETTVTDYFISLASTYFKRANKQLFIKNKPRRALRNIEKAVQFLPYDEALMYARGLIKYEIGDVPGAEKDWNRIQYLSKIGTSESNLKLLSSHYNYEKLSGYERLTSYLNN